MHEADLYRKSNVMQKRDAMNCLREYSKKIKWKGFHDRILDIGCGDGSVTVDLLRSCIPGNFELIGCDISEEMVKFANENYKDGHTSFIVQDIQATLNDDLVSHFDHVFSFYALHWIKDQKKAFTNIYDLLDSNGDCLLIFLGHMPIFDIYRIMAEQPKWKNWLKNVNDFISPYHDVQDPEKEITRMMDRIGFKNVKVQCKEMMFVFDGIEILKKAVIAVNPFNIPKTLQEDFLNDYLQVVRDMRLMDEANNNIGDEISVRAHYKLIVTYATK